MSDDFARHPYFVDWDTWELLSTPMLDTHFPRSERRAIDHVLRSRGIVGLKRLKMRLIVVGGLWWNFFAGEWLALGLREILLGWALNACALGGAAFGLVVWLLLGRTTELGDVLAAFVAVPAGLLVARLTFLVVHSYLTRRFGAP